MANFVNELIHIADAVAREKGIPKGSVVEAIEDAIKVVANKKYGFENTIKVEVNRYGNIEISREYLIVEDDAVEDTHTQITLYDAQTMPSFRTYHEDDADFEVGKIVREPLPAISLGRVAAQSAKQVIITKIKDAERERQYEEFKGHQGQILHVIVKRVERGNVVCAINSTNEGMIFRDKLIRGELLRVNDKVRVFVEEVRQSSGYQIVLSRASDDFLMKLCEQEIPEVYSGVVSIKAVARDAGSKAKVAVLSHDRNVDPVGACVGIGGSRMNAISNEIHGERVDIVLYSEDPATFVVNALSPAEVQKVIIDEERGLIEVVVQENQLSLAIGRRGQNVRLASRLTGWKIEIISEEDESVRRTEEFNKTSQLFIDSLNIDDVIAHLLVSEGFCSLEDVAYVPIEELASIDGFDEDIASELRQRSREIVESSEKIAQAELKELGVEDAVLELKGITNELAVALGKNDVKTVDDVADLARDEFKEFTPDINITNDAVDEIIMAARQSWFDNNQ